MTDEPSAPWNVLKLLNWTKDHFAGFDVDEPRLSAEILLADALKCRRIELYTRYDYVAGDDELTAFRELVRRAAGGEPIAYLIGEKEFYSIRFRITPEVLIPRGETELLVAEAVARLKASDGPGRVWDACTGSGCVAVATAANAPRATVLATDISPQAVALAAENAAAHGLGDRVWCRQADLLTLPADCADRKTFDVITANPPYVAEGDEIAESVRHEPTAALYGGRDGLDFIRRIVAEAPDFLAPVGALIMEFGFHHADDVRDLVCATGAFGEPRIIRDRQEIERVVVAVKR